MLRRIEPTQNVTVAVYRRGALARLDRISNRFVAVGLKAAVELLGEQNRPVEFVGLGTHDTPVSPQDEALGNEVFRNAVTRRLEFDNYVRFQLQVLSTQGVGNTFYEAGLFTAPRRWPFSVSASAYNAYIGTGILLARCVLVPVTMDGSTSFVLTWDVPIQGA